MKHFNEAKREMTSGKEVGRGNKNNMEKAGDEDQLQLFLGFPLLQRGRGNSGIVHNIKIRSGKIDQRAWAFLQCNHRKRSHRSSGNDSNCWTRLNAQEHRLGKHTEERQKAKGREDPGLKYACDKTIRFRRQQLK